MIERELPYVKSVTSLEELESILLEYASKEWTTPANRLLDKRDMSLVYTPVALSLIKQTGVDKGQTLEKLSLALNF